MKLATFTHDGQTRIGVVDDDAVIDLAAAAPSLPTNMLAFLEAGDSAMAAARDAAASGGSKIPLSETTIEAPIARPPKILAAGLNYKDHIAETGFDTPKIPIIFNKQSTSVQAPGGEIHRPADSEQLDYEGELGVVIGKRCRRVSRDEAPSVVAGYTVCNDVSVRDWQLRVPTMTMGKSWDTHCPFGPYIVTSDEVGNPHNLDLETQVNGETRQKSNTRELLFDSFDLIEHLSTAFTLEPGDLILTGTCGGVAVAMNPQKWMVPGDRVTVTIEKLGTIDNTVVEDPTR